MSNGEIVLGLLVPAHPHPLLCPEKNPGWARLREAYEQARLILEESLTSAGFETKDFSSGDELIKELEHSTPDLIITDVQMPGMLGTPQLVTDKIKRIQAMIFISMLASTWVEE